MSVVFMSVFLSVFLSVSSSLRVRALSRDISFRRKIAYRAGFRILVPTNGDRLDEAIASGHHSSRFKLLVFTCRDRKSVV